VTEAGAGAGPAAPGAGAVPAGPVTEAGAAGGLGDQGVRTGGGQAAAAARPASPPQAKPVNALGLFFSILWERIKGLFGGGRAR
jgi:hypothetical protein